MNHRFCAENVRKATLVITMLTIPTLPLWAAGDKEGAPIGTSIDAIYGPAGVEVTVRPSPCELDTVGSEASGAHFSDSIESMLKYASLVESYQSIRRALYNVENIGSQSISFRWMPMDIEVSFRSGLPPQEAQQWKVFAKNMGDFELDVDATIDLDQTRGSGPHEAPAYVETANHVCGGGVEISNNNLLVG